MTLSTFRVPRLLRPALTQLLRVACPSELRTLGLEARAVEQAELFLRSLSPGIRFGFLGALSALELSAALRPSSRGKVFSQLDFEHALAHFDGWWHSHRAMGHAMAKALKATVVMGFYELREVRERLGYDPDSWIAKVARRRLDSYGAEIRAHERALFVRQPLRAAASAADNGVAATDPSPAQRTARGNGAAETPLSLGGGGR